MGSASTKKRKVVVLGRALAAFRNPEGDNKQSLKFSTQARGKGTIDEDWQEYIRRASLKDATSSRRLSYADTSEAWQLLNRSFNQHDTKETQPQGQSSYGFRALIDAPLIESDAEKILDNANLLPEYFNYTYQDDNDVEEIKLCTICCGSNFLREPIHPCRICAKVYHDACLKEKGHCSDEHSLLALEESKTEIGWSCPECENLSSLLTEEENLEIIDVFEKAAGNGTFINRQQFLQGQKDTYKRLVGMPMPHFREEQEVKLFENMDRNKNGNIEWWEYVPPMCIRLLSRKSPDDLICHLTALELDKVRALFATEDQSHSGLIPISAAKKVYLKWYLSLIRMDSKEREYKEWLGGLHDGLENTNARVAVRLRQKRISWMEYLRLNSLYILAARPNTTPQLPYVPTINSALETFSNRREGWDEEDDAFAESIASWHLPPGFPDGT